MRRSCFTVAVVMGFWGAAAFAGEAPADAPHPTKPRVLPGVHLDGGVQLPNQWSLRPAGKHLPLGDFPVNIAIHPDGKWAAILHAGYGQHEIALVELQGAKLHLVSRVSLDQTFYGICFSPDGKTLYASGGEFEVVHAFHFDRGLLSDPRDIPVAAIADTFVVAGVAVDPAGQTLFAAGPWGDAVAVVPLDNPQNRRTVRLDKGSFPYACLADAKGDRLFVSLWGSAAVAVIDPGQAKVVETWPTESHPTEMALSPDGKTLFVACANSSQVSVLDASNHGKSLETLRCSLYPDAPSGNTPNSLALTPDGRMLFVANADASNLAVFNVTSPGHSESLGFIPTGWYPTSVRYNPADQRLYVAEGKGLSSRSNPQGPNPAEAKNLGSTYQYIAGLLQGDLSAIELPGPDKLADYTKQAYTCSPLRPDQAPTGDWPEDSPIPHKVGGDSPIKHCIYIIKENRTYDQILGDVKEGDGDPDLCLFGEMISPNYHKLARQFVLLDNFYVDGEVSADGHQWSMGAYATDFVEKVWPLNYRGSPRGKLTTYPSEGNYDPIARPAGGYIWDRCAEANVSYRSYGEWVDNAKKAGDPAVPRVKALVGHIDPDFHGWDLDYPDVRRAERFIAELHRFELGGKDGDMPSLSILRLPNDHTTGTKIGKPTPRAMIADNDLALGMVVEAVSKSKFWQDTAIFVLEDDAQNGPDHVDAHRSPALVVSAYTKRNYVDSTMYSTSSALRTMELILGLKPMSQFDAAARPMANAFQAKPDLTPYEHAEAQADLKETNTASAWGAKQSEQFDFDEEDKVDDLAFNDVIWRSVKGASSPAPAPVRAAFVRPTDKGDKDDDH